MEIVTKSRVLWITDQKHKIGQFKTWYCCRKKQILVTQPGKVRHADILKGEGEWNLLSKKGEKNLCKAKEVPVNRPSSHRLNPKSPLRNRRGQAPTPCKWHKLPKASPHPPSAQVDIIQKESVGKGWVSSRNVRLLFQPLGCFKTEGGVLPGNPWLPPVFVIHPSKEVHLTAFRIRVSIGWRVMLIAYCWQGVLFWENGSQSSIRGLFKVSQQKGPSLGSSCVTV